MILASVFNTWYHSMPLRFSWRRWTTSKDSKVQPIFWFIKTPGWKILDAVGSIGFLTFNQEATSCGWERNHSFRVANYASTFWKACIWVKYQQPARERDPKGLFWNMLSSGLFLISVCPNTLVWSEFVLVRLRQRRVVKRLLRRWKNQNFKLLRGKSIHSEADHSNALIPPFAPFSKINTIQDFLLNFGVSVHLVCF